MADRAVDRELRDEDDSVAELILGVAMPRMRQILARHVRAGGALTAEDAEDIASAISLRLVEKLRRASVSPDDAIQDLGRYAATLTLNAVSDHLRRRFPERARLKNRLRYVFKHDARLGLWMHGETPVAGLAGWQGRRPSAKELAVGSGSLAFAMRNKDRLADAVTAVLTEHAGPVVFEAVVDAMAALWGVADRETASAGTMDFAARSAPVSFESRQHLRALWAEVRELSAVHRKSLLLNLRQADTVNVLSLLVLTGVAKFQELAEALEMSASDLAAIWNDLPLDDLTIASRMGVTRQQVINHRKSARERLARRMRPMRRT